MKLAERLTDEDVVVGRVGEDHGVTERTGGVVCGASRNRHTAEGNAMVLRPRCRGCAVGRASFTLRKVQRGRSCDEEGREEFPSSSSDTHVSWRRGLFGYLATWFQSSVR